MALATVHWKSAVLGKHTTLQVLLPETGRPPYPTFYLLHGLTDDSSTWCRRTRIEWYARELPMIVVMPDGYRGFYTRHEEGPDYAKHFGEEIPEFVEKTFPATADRAARAIGGLSMGGYGALRVGLGYADRFCSVNCHSGGVRWGESGAEAATRNLPPELLTPAFAAELRRIFGDNPHGSDHDLLKLARAAAAAGRLPGLLIDCGTEDYLIEDSRHLHAELEEAGVPHVYREHPGGHSWDYWDAHIGDALRFHAQNLGLQVQA